jgi:hypothetical protein
MRRHVLCTAGRISFILCMAILLSGNATTTLFAQEKRDNTEEMNRFQEVFKNLPVGFTNPIQIEPDATRIYSLDSTIGTSDSPAMIASYSDALAMVTRQKRLFYSASGSLRQMEEYKYEKNPDPTASLYCMDVEGETILLVDRDFITAVNKQGTQRMENNYQLISAILLGRHVVGVTSYYYRSKMSANIIELNFDNDIVGKRVWDLTIVNFPGSYYGAIFKLPPRCYALITICNGELAFSNGTAVFDVQEDKIAQRRTRINLNSLENYKERGFLVNKSVIEGILTNGKRHFVIDIGKNKISWRFFPFSSRNRISGQTEYPGKDARLFCLRTFSLYIQLGGRETATAFAENTPAPAGS